MTGALLNTSTRYLGCSRLPTNQELRENRGTQYKTAIMGQQNKVAIQRMIAAVRRRAAVIFRNKKFQNPRKKE